MQAVDSAPGHRCRKIQSFGKGSPPAAPARTLASVYRARLPCAILLNNDSRSLAAQSERCPNSLIADYSISDTPQVPIHKTTLPVLYRTRHVYNTLEVTKHTGSTLSLGVLHAAAGQLQ
jgi:hypothetical protein